MESRAVGRSGLQVSRTGLGTMTWGRDTDEYEARDQFELFLEAGGTLFDTADVYGSGAAEELLGTLVAETGVRDDVVLVTKAGGRRVGDRRFDTSRRHLLRALDGSLTRLGTDYVDLWLVHGWDDLTPIEETLSALAHAQESGRARYVGVSNYRPWQLARAATLAQRGAGIDLVPTRWSTRCSRAVPRRTPWLPRRRWAPDSWPGRRSGGACSPASIGTGHRPTPGVRRHTSAASSAST